MMILLLRISSYRAEIEEGKLINRNMCTPRPQPPTVYKAKPVSSWVPDSFFFQPTETLRRQLRYKSVNSPFTLNVPGKLSPVPGSASVDIMSICVWLGMQTMAMWSWTLPQSQSVTQRIAPARCCPGRATLG